ncbi:MAG: HAD family hydrolase [Victivallales bacterium]|nr:HAD family hydrolase [Victivallales bacterium]
MDWEKLYFLIDIDGTITDYHGEIKSSFVLEFIQRVMVERGMTEEDAAAKIREATHNVLRWDYSELIFGNFLPWDETVRAIKAEHQKMLRVHTDTVQMIRSLHDNGAKLHIISNNPYWGCRWKLERAGLDPAIFRQIFCTDFNGGCKSSPDVWKFVLPRLGTEAKNVITVGDDLNEDGLIPQKFGVGHSFILKHGRNIPSPNANISCIENATKIVEVCH